jgi:hypothetical protein
LADGGNTEKEKMAAEMLIDVPHGISIPPIGDTISDNKVDIILNK